MRFADSIPGTNAVPVWPPQFTSAKPGEDDGNDDEDVDEAAEHSADYGSGQRVHEFRAGCARELRWRATWSVKSRTAPSRGIEKQAFAPTPSYPPCTKTRRRGNVANP